METKIPEVIVPSLPTFSALLKEAKQSSGIRQFYEPKWWRVMRNLGMACTNAGSVVQCKRKDGIFDSHTDEDVVVFSIALLGEVVGIIMTFVGKGWSVWNFIGIAISLISSFSMYFAPYISAVSMWRFHAKDREALMNRKPEEFILRFTKEKLAKERKRMLGTNAPLVKKREELDQRAKAAETLVHRITSRIGRREDFALKETMRKAREEAIALLTARNNLRARLDDYLSRTAAFFDECDTRVKGLEPVFEDRALLEELRREQDKDIGLEAEVEDLILAAHIRLEAGLATLRDSVVRVSGAIPAFTEDADKREAALQEARMETALAEAVESFPTPPNLLLSPA